MIYFDNAATTLKKPECVKKAVMAAFDSLGNANRGAHQNTLDASILIYKTREKLAKLFNADDPSNVVFTSNSTESLNIAINGIINENERVITTDMEHNSVLRPLYKLQGEKNVDIQFVKVDKCGKLDYSDFEKLIDEKTSAIVCTHASNLTGNILDIKKIGEITKKYNLKFIVDASQTAGEIEIDMKKMNIDVLCFTGHKALFGPQGTGGLVCNEKTYIRPFKTGGTGVKSFSKTQPNEMPTRLEAGTLNGYGIAGLSAALDWIEETGRKNIHEYEINLMNRFLSGIKDIEDIKIYGEFGTERTAVVAINLSDIDSSIISDVLFCDYKIATRPGAHCAPRMHMALGTETQGAVRFSFSYFNTKEEVDIAINALKEIRQRMNF